MDFVVVSGAALTEAGFMVAAASTVAVTADIVKPANCLVTAP